MRSGFVVFNLPAAREVESPSLESRQRQPLGTWWNAVLTGR